MRTSRTPRSLRHARKPSSSCASIATACFNRGSLSNRSSDALAAAQASGLPENVGPCVSARLASSERNAS
jgi:hypothetical protein